MKTPVVDYRRFRFSRLNTPEFSHLKLLAGWLAYFALYFLTENLIPPEKCHLIHIWLDDKIPFCEYFLVFYVGWYVLVFGSLLWTGLYDIKKFRQIQIYIMITQALAMAIYILWPSRQDLRPEVFPRENAFTWLLGLIYAFDTSTGVFPSLHVAYSLGILSAFLHDRDFSKVGKALITLFVLGVCASVCFVKQHSAADVLGAIPVCLIAEYFVFIRPKRKKAAHS